MSEKIKVVRNWNQIQSIPVAVFLLRQGTDRQAISALHTKTTHRANREKACALFHVHARFGCLLLYNAHRSWHNRSPKPLRNTMPPTDTPNDEIELLRHLAIERIAPQWADFLMLLGSELGLQLSPQELRQFLTRLGSQFAESLPLGPCADITDLESAINRVWSSRQWGFAKVSDLGQHLQVTHLACPLPAALQLDAEVAGGFLEGAYGVWLRAAGAPPELTLRQQPSTGLHMQMVFELTAH